MSRWRETFARQIAVFLDAIERECPTVLIDRLSEPEAKRVQYLPCARAFGES
jgi:hypothetical protein